MLKFSCISDTHNRVPNEIISKIPQDTDQLIHCGDFSMQGEISEVQIFIKFIDYILSERPSIKNIILIGGNHDFCMDEKQVPDESLTENYSSGLKLIKSHPKIIQLDNSLQTEPTKNIKILGVPQIPKINGFWAFEMDGLEREKHWQKVFNQQKEVDILITHSPPEGQGDQHWKTKDQLGCEWMIDQVNKVGPKQHCYGHIHEGQGRQRNGKTEFLNCALLDEKYQCVHDPLVFEI